MMLLRSLKESLKLLMKEPKIFIPNIFVSLLYGFYEIALIKLGLDMLSASQADSAGYVSANASFIALVFAFYPLIGTLDLITYSMYPSIVRDHKEARKVSLIKAFRSALSAWRLWVSLGLVIIAFMLVMTPIVSVFFALSYFLENPLILIPAVLLVLVATAFLALSVFFVIPVGIIDKEKTFASYRKSFRMSIRHRREVLPLLGFSIAMAFFLAYIVNSSKPGSGQELTYLALGLFLSAKIIQSMVYTYISVVNPYLYTELR